MQTTVRRHSVVHVLVTTVLLGAAVHANAQETEPAQPSRSFEIGTAVGGAGVWSPYGSEGLWFGDIRTKVPLTDRFALDAFVSIPQREYAASHGFYGVQVKQRILRASHGRTEAFATYGGIGYYEHSPARDWSYTDSRGTTQVYHVASRTDVSWPLLPAVGGGLQRRVTDRLIVRFDAQGLIVPFVAAAGARVSVGVWVPLGRIAAGRTD